MALPLLFLGDSHIAAFQRAAERQLLGDRESLFCLVGGATAVGMRNPNGSKTDAIGKFRHVVDTLGRTAVVVIQLGEVDCGFVIWYRAEKYGEAPDLQVKASIEAYFSFVDELVGKGCDRIIITGATLPTIRDDQDWGQVADARRAVRVPLRERISLTFDYNDRLRRGAHARGLAYVDISAEVFDPAIGEIREEFRNPDPFDHHLHYDKSAACWAIHLNKVLSENRW